MKRTGSKWKKYYSQNKHQWMGQFWCLKSSKFNDFKLCNYKSGIEKRVCVRLYEAEFRKISHDNIYGNK
jgi:hypothetical protein